LTNWSAEQDRRVDASLERLDAIFRDPCVLRRIWGHLDEMILQHHVYNGLVAYKPEDRITIVDIGCGGGELIHMLSIYFKNAKLFGIDYNQRSIIRAQDLLGHRASLVAGAYDDVFSEVQEADLVFCSEVFEHVEDPSHLLSTLSRLVKPGGYLSLSTPSGWMWWLPSLSGFVKLFRSPKKFHDLYLTPETHWKAALSIHPAVRPKKLRALLKREGFRIKLRRSALWRMNINGVIYWFFSLYARKRPIHASRVFESYYRFLDALMNICPLFRVFETRIILLAQKEPDKI
jgi:2-polyprenyl-3-methyl-5-hydroxy-6-metoxy-1,4-benzoquinol methylase